MWALFAGNYVVFNLRRLLFPVSFPSDVAPTWVFTFLLKVLGIPVWGPIQGPFKITSEVGCGAQPAPSEAKPAPFGGSLRKGSNEKGVQLPTDYQYRFEVYLRYLLDYAIVSVIVQAGTVPKAPAKNLGEPWGILGSIGES